MRPLTKFKKLFGLTILFSAILFFQNCSDVQFDNTEVTDPTVTYLGGETIENPRAELDDNTLDPAPEISGGDIEVVMQHSYGPEAPAPVPMPVQGGNTVTTTPPATSPSPPVVQAPPEIKDIVVNHVKCEDGMIENNNVVDHQDSDLHFVEQAGRSAHKNIQNLTIEKSHGRHVFLNVEHTQAIQQLSGHYRVQSQSVGIIQQINGNYCVAAMSVEQVSHLSGIISIKGPNMGGYIQKISDMSGKLYIKNMDIGEISYFSGKIILENSSIANIAKSVSGQIFTVTEDGTLKKLN